jgi:transcriptional regulator with XRE-family HTH domain
MAALRNEEGHSERFGELLFRLREAQNLSQNAAAKRLGISQPRLRDYELGRDPHSGKPTLPPPTTIRAIAKLYRFPEEKLLLLAGFLPRPITEIEADEILGLLNRGE